MHRVLFFVLLAATALAQVQSRVITLHDSTRNKDLHVTVTYSAAGTKSPFIVFSHGAGGSPSGYSKFAQLWAANGYIVAQPEHDDSVALRRRNGHSGSFIREMNDIRDDGAGWQNRFADVSMVIASAAEIERQIPELKGRIDTARIGVGGHSYGAYTTQVIAGALVTLPGAAKASSFRNAAPKAFLMMSPQGEGQMGLTADSWSQMDRPFLIMTGAYDDLTMTGARGADWRKEPYTKSPAGEKYFAFFAKANHMSFTDRVAAGKAAPLMPGRDPSAPDVQKNVLALSLLWWDAMLKGDASARQRLRSGDFARASNGVLTIEYK